MHLLSKTKTQLQNGQRTKSWPRKNHQKIWINLKTTLPYKNIEILKTVNSYPSARV